MVSLAGTTLLCLSIYISSGWGLTLNAAAAPGNWGRGFSVLSQEMTNQQLRVSALHVRGDEENIIAAASVCKHLGPSNLPPVPAVKHAAAGLLQVSPTSPAGLDTSTCVTPMLTELQTKQIGVSGTRLSATFEPTSRDTTHNARTLNLTLTLPQPRASRYRP